MLTVFRSLGLSGADAQVLHICEQQLHRSGGKMHNCGRGRAGQYWGESWSPYGCIKGIRDVDRGQIACRTAVLVARLCPMLLL